MAQFSRPAYYPQGYMQTPMQPSFQNNPGFPRGFPAARYAQQSVHGTPLPVTPTRMTFPLLHEEHEQWLPAPTDSEASESESESDSDDSMVFKGVPLQQTYHSDWNPPRGRSNSRSAAGHRQSASYAIPGEQSRGSSAPPPTVPMAWLTPQQRPISPFFAPQNLPLHRSTPFHSNAHLPLAHQTQPLFHHQMPATHQPNPPYGVPTGHPPQMQLIYNQPFQQFSQMPPRHYPPAHAHASGSGIHHSVPQPGIIPVQKVRRKSWVRSKSKDRSSLYGMFPYHQWGKEAALQAIIDPNRISGKDLRRVELHPLLAPGCRDLLLFNIIRLPARLAVPGNHSIEDYFSSPATSPPMNQFTFWTGVHDVPITIENPAGVTVENVIRYVGEMMFRKLKRATWNAFSEERRAEITDFFHHNRTVGVMPPVEKGIVLADLLSENTIFCGMQLCQKLPNGHPTPPGTFMIRWASS